MNKVLKLFLLTVAAGACALPAIRAETTNPTCPNCPACMPRQERREKFRQHSEERGERMAKALGLTADQQARMKVIAEGQRTAADAVRADASLTPDQKHEKVKQIQEDFKARRQALLTPEQQVKAEEMRAKFREHRKLRADKTDKEN